MSPRPRRTPMPIQRRPAMIGLSSAAGGRGGIGLFAGEADFFSSAGGADFFSSAGGADFFSSAGGTDFFSSAIGGSDTPTPRCCHRPALLAVAENPGVEGLRDAPVTRGAEVQAVAERLGKLVADAVAA